MALPPPTGTRRDPLILQKASIKLHGRLFNSIKGIKIELEDRLCTLNSERTIATEFPASRKTSTRDLPERFSCFYIYNSPDFILRLQPKIQKSLWKMWVPVRSEQLPPTPFEISGSELHSKCPLSIQKDDIFEFIPDLPPEYGKQISMKFSLQFGRQNMVELSQIIKMLGEKVEAKESVMDKLGCIGTAIDAVLTYGKLVAELNPFAKVAFEVTEQIFKSIKNEDKCKEQVCALMGRIRSTLDNAQRLQDDLDRFTGIVNRILVLAEGVIRVVRDFEKANLARAALSSSGVLEEVGRLREGLDNVIKEFDLSVAVHIKQDTKQILTRIDCIQVTVEHAELGVDWIHQDIGYVQEDIQDMRGTTKDIQEHIEEIRQGQQDQNRRGDLERMREWLSDMEFVAFPVNTHGARFEGSGKWFLECEDFIDWKTGVLRLLWCLGIPGSGKTTMSYIVLKHLRSNSPPPGGHCILNVYCRHNRKAKQTVPNLLRCMWAQLTSQRSYVSRALVSIYDQHVNHRVEPSEDELMEALLDEFRSFATVYIVIDGLDECGEDAAIEGFAMSITALAQAPNVRLFVASRPYPIIRNILTGLPTKFHPYTLIANRGDMERYIEKEFKSPPLRFAQAIDKSTVIDRKTLMNTVIEKASGMFLLVRLLIGNLRALQTTHAIEQGLDKLVTLDTGDDEQAAGVLQSAYDDTMRRIREHELADYVLKLLRWVIYAEEWLSIDALRYALIRIEPKDTTLHKSKLVDRDALISACAGLVTIEGSYGEGSVRVVHETTESYLRGVLGSPVECHTSIMNTCLSSFYLPVRYLAESDVDDVDPDRQFLGYAIRFWSEHARNTDQEAQKHAAEFLKTCNNANEGIMRVLLRCHFYPRHGRYPNTDLSTELASSWTPLHLTAIFGLCLTLEQELKGANIDTLMAMDSDRRTPLGWAAIGGTLDPLAILLKHTKFGLNWMDNRRLTPLNYAANRGDTKIIKFLLDDRRTHCDFHGPNHGGLGVAFDLLIDQDDADFGDLLHGLSFWDFSFSPHDTVEMVSTILKKGIDFPNRCDKWGWSPLSYAVRNSRYSYKLSTVLLGYGVDPLLADKTGISPFLHALDTILGRREPEGGFFAILKHLCQDRTIEMERYSAIIDSFRSHKVSIPEAAAWILGGDYPRPSHINDKISLGSLQQELVYEILHQLNINPNLFRISQGANLIHVNPRTGRNLLSYAAENERTDIFPLLIKSGADPFLRDHTGRSPISFAASQPGETLSGLLDALDVSRINREAMTTVINQCDNAGRTPLSHVVACQFENSKTIKQLIENYGADFQFQDPLGRSVLSHAVCNHSKDAVKTTRLLLDLGADPNSTDSLGRSVLSYAAQHGRTDVTKLVLDTLRANTSKLPLAVYLKPDNQGRTVFSYFMENMQDESWWSSDQCRWSSEMAEALCGGGDINRADLHGCTPIMYAAKAGNDEALKWLASSVGDPVFDLLNNVDNMGHTALSHMIVLGGSCRAVRSFMDDQQLCGCINRVHPGGRSLLSYCAAGGRRFELGREREREWERERERFFQLWSGLLQKDSLWEQWEREREQEDLKTFLSISDIHVDRPDDANRTPLSYASEIGRNNLVKILLARRDVNPNSVDSQGRTPLSYAAQGAGKEWRETVAALLDRLDQDGVPSNGCDKEGYSPLHYALQAGDPGVIGELLLHQREETKRTDANGRTWLSHAAQEGRRQVASTFLDFSSKEDVNIRDTEGRTAVSYAAERGDRVIVARLFNADADLNIEDKHGKTPLSYATENGHKHVVNYLERKGARFPSSDSGACTALSSS